ncbi:hypothetical protein [Streptomyces sp. 8N616]|uniref:hypothetical protein n=1 Tax=Streptomyces sp. 8N616 TaxID=3457414 RepID=UPI003FCFD554
MHHTAPPTRIARWGPAIALAVGMLAVTPYAAAADSCEIKVYVVKTKEENDGQKEYLYEIAEETLGDGERYTEIFDLNEGRRQKDGGALSDPEELEPGWVLELPDDAQGSDVQTSERPECEEEAEPAKPRPESKSGPQPSREATAEPVRTPKATATATRTVTPTPSRTPAKATEKPVAAAPPTTPASADSTETTASGSSAISPTVGAALALVLLFALLGGAVLMRRRRPAYAGTAAGRGATPRHPRSYGSSSPDAERAAYEPDSDDTAGPDRDDPDQEDRGQEDPHPEVLAQQALDLAAPDDDDRQVAGLVDRALRSLSAAARTNGAPLPLPHIVTVSPDSVTLRLPGAGARLPEPWRVRADGASWSAPRTAVAGLGATGAGAAGAGSAGAAARPQPVLVTLGEQDGSRVLVDLSRASGIVCLDGHEPMVRALTGAFIDELATAPWAANALVVQAGFGEDPPAESGGRVATADTLEDALTMLDPYAGMSAATPFGDEDGGPADHGVLVLADIPTGEAAARLAALAADRDRGCTVLVLGSVPGTRWHLRADPNGILDVEALDLRVDAASRLTR